MKRIIPFAVAAALALAGCSGDPAPDATTTTTTASSDPTATASRAPVALDEAFCDDAETLYQRDAAVSEAIAEINPSSLSTAEMADPDIFQAYLVAIDLEGWESWRELYLQASADSGSTEMEGWIDAIVSVTDQQFAAYAEAAETSTTLTEWGQAVSDLLADLDEEIEVEGDEALLASEASMATCGVPLSVSAGAILGYEG